MKNYNILLLGDSGVGKTSFLYRFTNLVRGLRSVYDPLPSFDVTKDVVSTQVKINDNVTYTFWDFGGDDLFKSLNCDYYNIADMVLFFFDRTRLITLYGMGKFLSEYPDEKNIPYAIIGNKSDSTGLISENKVEDFINDYMLTRGQTNIFGKDISYIPVSCLNGEKFLLLVKSIIVGLK